MGFTLVGDLTKKAYTLPPLSVTVAKYWIPCCARYVRNSDYERSYQQQCMKSRTSSLYFGILKVVGMAQFPITDAILFREVDPLRIECQ